MDTQIAKTTTTVKSKPVYTNGKSEYMNLLKKINITNAWRVNSLEEIQFVDFRFVDFLGKHQHFTVPIYHLTESAVKEGFGFDGSSIKAWKDIHESDMLILPDVSKAYIDPFYENPTLVVISDVHEPLTYKAYPRCPRGIARRAEAYLKKTGIADVAYFGPEAEFFVFDRVKFDEGPNFAHYEVDSEEGAWNTGEFGRGYRPTTKGGYFPVPPNDSLQDLRSRMVSFMNEAGIDVEAQHHEVASGGQCEIDIRFNNLLTMADGLMNYKYMVKNAAWQSGKTVTFMPKPIFGDNGSGMHVHQSLWKGGKNLFAGKDYAGLSKEALWYIGGLLKHSKALIAFTNPTINSFKRLVPGFEAPVNLVYSQRNRSAAIRIPMYSDSVKAKRLELRYPDPSCNPYLAFSAMLMAGLDGIKNKIDPGKSLDKDIYALNKKELSRIPSAPRDLEEALNHLERDHEFLLQGDVFTEEVIEAWITYKYESEVQAARMRPSPFEFAMYFDC